jgi:hypothetical protein
VARARAGFVSRSRFVVRPGGRCSLSSELVVSWSALGVDECWWGEPGVAVDQFDGPVAAVDQPVVLAAEKCQVVDLGRAALKVGSDVVGVADARRAVAGRERASAVAEDECPSDVGGYDVGGYRDIQRLGVAAHHHWQYMRVA